VATRIKGLDEVEVIVVIGQRPPTFGGGFGGGSAPPDEPSEEEQEECEIEQISWKETEMFELNAARAVGVAACITTGVFLGPWAGTIYGAVCIAVMESGYSWDVRNVNISFETRMRQCN
jgi:hypothetical protein